MFMILAQSLVLFLALRVSSLSWDEATRFVFCTFVVKFKLFSVMEIISRSFCKFLHCFRIDWTIASDISWLISASQRVLGPDGTFSAPLKDSTSAYYQDSPHRDQAKRVIIVPRSFTIRSTWISSRAETTFGILQKSSCNLFIRSWKWPCLIMGRRLACSSSLRTT